MSSPELRIDQLTGLRTLLAPGRAERPDGFAARSPERAPGAADTCPFCEGREDRTPPEVWANRPGGGAADSPGWLQRAVPNLYPALEHEAGDEPADGPAASGLSSAADPLSSSSRMSEPELFRAVHAGGAHEVIVNSPRHVTALADLDESELAGAMAAWRERVAAHSGEASYVQLIVNEGPEAAGPSAGSSPASCSSAG